MSEMQRRHDRRDDVALFLLVADSTGALLPYAAIVVLVLAALVGPVLLARAYFGGWLETGTLVVAAVTAEIASLLARDVRRGRAGLLDVLLVSAAVLVSVLVVNALLADAGWPGLSQ